MSWRRLVAIALLFVPLQASAFAWMRADGGHRCDDHVCACVRACPTKKKAGGHGCHGASEQQAAMSAACHHDVELGTPVASAPHVVPEVTAASRPPMQRQRRASPDDETTLSGFHRVGRRPPRLS